MTTDSSNKENRLTNAFIITGMLFLAVVLAGILVCTAMPNAAKNRLAEAVENRIQAAAPAAAELAEGHVPAMGHFLLFGLFGLLLALVWRRAPFWAVLAVILGLAGGTELVQIFVVDRSPLWRDIAIDAAGGAAGAALLRWGRTAISDGNHSKKPQK